MNSLKKNLSLVMAIVILLSAMLLMVSCQKGNETDDGASTTAPEQSNVELFNFAESGKANVKIIFKISSSAYVTEAVEALQSAVTNGSGLTFSKDYDEMHKPADGGIVVTIGETQYTESTEAVSALAANSYSINVYDNKIVVAASHPYLYTVAINKLISELRMSDGVVSVPKGYSYKSESYSAVSISSADAYTIVYPDGDDEAMAVANTVKLGLQDAGVIASVVSDQRSSLGKVILVGDTKNGLSDYDAKKDYKCAIIKKADEGHIALTGNYKAAAERFIKYVSMLSKEKSGISLLDPMFGVFAADGMGWAPNYTGGGTLEIKDSFEMSGSFYLLIHNATSKDYSAYLKTLEDVGFKCYHSVSSNGNSFSTYTDGYNILTLSQISYDEDDIVNYDSIYKTPSNGKVSYMTVGVDCIDNSALPERNTEIEDITTEQITTIGTSCGYVLRLSDGRFVVFDGGMPNMASKVYEVICNQNVINGKPVIAAWFLTHGHSDHIGAINSFVATYSSKVTIENFVHNLPAYEQYNGKNVVEIDPAKESQGLYDRSVAYYNDIQKYYPKANIIVARAGQRFEYGNIDIDVLFTCENLYKKQMLDTNGSSVVYSITGDSGRMLILGDLIEVEGGVLNAVYEEALDCDLVQVAHHGYNNGHRNMYDSINAEYAIWTRSYEDVIGSKGHIQSVNKRNQFNYKSVYANLIPKNNGPAITLKEGMTKADIIALDVGLTG